MHSDSNIVVPHLANSSHVAEFTVDSLASNQWVTRNDTWFPGRVAVVAVERSLIEVIVVAEFASSCWKVLSQISIHVDLENPVSDLVSLWLRKDVLFWDWNVMWFWDISAFKVGILLDHGTIWILNGIPKVDIPVEEDESHLVVSNLTVSISGIEESLISSNVFAVSEE